VGLLRDVLLSLALRFCVLLLLLVEVAHGLPVTLLAVSARFWGGVFDARLCGPAKNPSVPQALSSPTADSATRNVIVFIRSLLLTIQFF
jgi:hypothetical protein